MILTNATPATAMEKDKTIAIGAGQAANFDGFLVPEWQFRKINQDLIEKDMLLKNAQAPQIKEESHPIETFLWGFLAGSTTILLIDKFGGK